MNIKRIALVGALLVQSGSVFAINNPFKRSWSSSVVVDFKNLTIDSVDALKNAVAALKAKHEAKKDLTALKQDMANLFAQAEAAAEKAENTLKGSLAAEIEKAREELTTFETTVETAIKELAEKAKTQGVGIVAYIKSKLPFTSKAPVTTTPATQNNEQQVSANDTQALTLKEKARNGLSFVTRGYVNNTTTQADIIAKHTEEQNAKSFNLVVNVLKSDNYFISALVASPSTTFMDLESFKTQFVKGSDLYTKVNKMYQDITKKANDFASLSPFAQKLITSYSNNEQQAKIYAVHNPIIGHTNSNASLALEIAGQKIALLVCLQNPEIKTYQDFVTHITRNLPAMYHATTLRAIERITSKPMSVKLNETKLTLQNLHPVTKSALFVGATLTTFTALRLAQKGVFPVLKDIFTTEFPAICKAAPVIFSGIATGLGQAWYVAKDAIFSK